MRASWYLYAALAGLPNSGSRDDSDRGDVPGWVMVTLMSAILVVAILVPFRSQVVPAIQNAINSVVNAK